MEKEVDMSGHESVTEIFIPLSCLFSLFLLSFLLFLFVCLLPHFRLSSPPFLSLTYRYITSLDTNLPTKNMFCCVNVLSFLFIVKGVKMSPVSITSILKQ